jgi:DNA-binding beta-propeller fold protein YncE
MRLLACAVIALVVSPAGASFVTFESGQVRPLALSPDGTRLFAVNTPDNRLEIFDLTGGSPVHVGAVPVGLEPVAVAARTNGEVWVVNHLSDSVSIVDVSGVPRVVRTLLVGDEPRDIVFAGPGGNRAFITAAHRGQNRPGDPQLTTAGVGRADVWVFDATNLGTALGGNPLVILSHFGDTPRALAVAPGGGTVYAGVFHSGNRTTTVSEGAVCNGGASAGSCTVGGASMPGGLPAPNTNFLGEPGPETGLIVKFDPAAGEWRDQVSPVPRNWNNAVKFSLPDKDVFAINASAGTPAESGFFAGVGTVIFSMAVNPVSGKVYVTNTEARNEIRFEGPGIFGGSTVRGHLHEARITVLSGATVTPRHLNKHINYAVVPSPPGTSDDSLAIPMGMAVTSDGTTLYVAAFGSSKVGVFDTTALEADTFIPDASSHVTVTGGGPSGLVLDEPRDRLYVLTRFDNAISVIDTATFSEIAHLPVYNPEPASVVAGRPFLYDAITTSSNGEASCAACHVFGDLDSLGWDLGNPDDVTLNNPNPIRVGDPFGTAFEDFHPMKGPMTTQSLRGMANHGPMHWRGDRTGGNDPGGDPLDEDAAFKKFNVAFGGLLGRSGPLTAAQMQAFTDFILQVTYPPNPVRALTNQLTPDQDAGRTFFFGPVSDVFQTCNGCHRLDPAAGFFGSDGFMSFENEPQLIKIPHLRNMYQKVGMFGMLAVPFFNAGDNGNKGDQIRGFGFLHDGSVDTLFRFHNAVVFNQCVPGFGCINPGGFASGAAGNTQRRQVEAFMLAFDSNLAPVVGQQITLTATNGATVGARINLLIARAAAGECDLVVKGNLAGEDRGWQRLGTGLFRSDRGADPQLTDAALRAQAGTAGQERTYTCVPPGSGTRVGVDRDEDGFLDRDELDAGSDPADPASTPPGGTTTTTTPGGSTTTTTIGGFVLVQSKGLRMKDRSAPPADPTRRRLRFSSITRLEPDPAHRIVPPPRNTPSDPTLVGGTLIVYNANPNPGSPLDEVVLALPAARWTPLEGSRGLKGYQYQDFTLGAPITKVKVKTDRLSVRGGKENWGYTLDEPSQGRVAVRVILGATGWCAEAPAKLAGTPPSTEKTDRQDRFVGARNSPPPAACPPLKSTGSPSGAFLDLAAGALE